MQIEVEIREDAIDPFAERDRRPNLPGCGGYVCFEGLVRDVNHGRKVERLDYEAYPILADKELRRIAEEARQLFNVAFVKALHRTGALVIGDTAVLIQVLGGHRDESFRACRFVIDEIKKRVPIWKKEYYDDGTSEWTRCHHHGGEHQ